MIKFNNKEIEYLKGQVKEAYNMLNGSEDEKEIMKFVDDEDRALVNKFIKDETLWDKVNTDEKVNKDVENICWNVEGMSNYWLRGYDSEDVLYVTEDKICADIYEKVNNK